MSEILLELSAFFVGLFCFWDCLKYRKKLYLPTPKGLGNKIRDQHFIFLVLLITLMVSAGTSVLEVSMERFFAYKSAFLLNLLNELYFVSHTFLSFMFTLYIINMTGVGKEKSSFFFHFFLAPFFMGEFLILSNPFTGFIFYVDESFTYNRGTLMWVLYAIAAIYLLLGVIFFFRYKNRLSKMDRSATLILISIAILGICIQGIWAITVELFFESVGFLGFMLLLEDKTIVDRSGKTSRINRNFIVVIAMIFITVISINIILIYHAGTDQTGKIGTIQIDNIKGDLQEALSEAEGNLLRFSMGMEQLASDSADLWEIERYIREQKNYIFDLTGGNCFNVYAASSKWTIIPDFDIPENYHAVERVWYLGAKKNEGEIFISEPYADAATGDLCFTLSALLSDGDIVVAMDYTLSRVQDSVLKMSEDENQLAMIVTKEGTIVGCTDAVLVGEKLSEVLPEYKDVFERSKASKEHRNFTTKIDRTSRIIFSNETSNGWQLILSVDYGAFYYDIFRQMVMLGAIDLLMVAVVIVFYLVSVNNQEKAENALASTESFISGLSEKLKKPVDDILKSSEEMLRADDASQDETLRGITESGKQLQEMMNNLFSYSIILRDGAEAGAAENKRKKRENSISSRHIQIGIISILVIALLTGLFLCVWTTTQWGHTRISKEAARYSNELGRWMLQQQSTLRMFSDVIVADPSVLDDYDKAVKWLDDVGQNYSEMSVCYMANPYNKAHPVIMNNGWVPEPGYRVEQRQWYLDTERSGDGYSISSPYLDAQTGLYCITFSRIVYSKEGDFLGIFAIDCFIDKLIDVLDDSYSDEGYAFLVDPDGTIINHPFKEYEMDGENSTNIEDTEYAEAFHRGSQFGIRDHDGRYVSVYAEKNEASGFTVLVVQNWWGIYGTVILVTMIFLIMLVASIVAVAYMISRFINWQEEANEKLVASAQAAVSAGKAKSRFLAQMSHEIRTPINAVLGMNEMILRETEDQSIREYAGNIQSAGKSLLGLINTILDFSKIEEGKMEILPVKYDTAGMIDNLIHSVSGRAEDKGLVFEAHVEKDIPSSMYGDDMRVSQVVINLLTNAVKYTKEGRVDLYVSGHKKDEETFCISFRVKDTGIGIKQEDLSKMFESFTRLEEDRNRTIEGTGLGMAIVTRLLSMMGSQLKVESEYGKGSQFSFEVEQAIVDATPIGDYKEKARAAALKVQDEMHLFAPKARILAVDDNDMNLKVVRNLLKLNGILPDMANSGEAALAKLGEGSYDIVLLDHMMPQMDGIETLHKAREQGLIGEKTTVIALTANAVVGAREAYLAEGFDDYLSKPVEIKALERALGKYLPESIVEYRKKTDAPGAAAPAEKKTEAPSQKTAEPPVAAKQPEASPKPDDFMKTVQEADDMILEFMPEDDATESEEKAADAPDSGEMYRVLEEHGIRTQEGLKYCGDDEEFYREILTDYAESGKERCEELQNAFDAKDWKNYGIKVHALKSAAKTVGDDLVFESARALEEAAKEEKADVIEEGHPKLLARYGEKIELIRHLG